MTLPSNSDNMFFWILGVVAFLLQVCKDFLWYKPTLGKEKKNDLWKIPGPVSLPLIGTTWIYLWRYKTTKVHEAYADMMNRYGEIMREVLIDGKNFVSLSNKDDIEKVLRYPSRYPFRPPSEIIENYRRSMPDKFASAGMANEQGEVWYNLRSKLTPELTSKKVMLGFLPELNVIGDDLMQLLKNNRSTDGKVPEFQSFAARYGLEACCTLVLGQRMTFMENEISTTAQKLSAAMNQRFLAERDSFYSSDLKKYKKTLDYKKYLDCENTVYSIISDIVDNARKSMDDIQYDDIKSILVSIIEKPDVDEREKKSVLIDFIAAGISTLSNSIIFLLYLLSKHPEVQKKIFEELEQISPNSNHITANDLTKMTYTKACMLEAFRIIPVAFALSRVLDEEMVLSGYRVPAGTFVLCQTMIACQNEKNFTNAKEFIPERWLDDNKQSQSAAASIYAPFGIGRRMCPGKRFIEQAMLVTVAKMVREYTIEFNDELDVQFEFILAAKFPVAFTLKERC